MIKIYGIKTCGSVRKAIGFFESKGIEYTFIDFKKVKPTKKELDFWLKYVPLETLFNKKGTTYKKLGLKELQLTSDSIKEWLLKEPLLIKRPVIECKIKSKDSVIVGFDEEIYNSVW